MATRTISVTEDAYLRLKRLKRGRESFSEVILRLTGREDLMRFSGSIGESLARNLAASSSDLRRRFDAEFEERTP